MSRKRIKKNKVRKRRPRGNHAKNAAYHRQQHANKMLQSVLKDVEIVEEKPNESHSDVERDS